MRRTEKRLEHVQFTGMVPKAEIPRYLAMADVCVAGLTGLKPNSSLRRPGTPLS